MSVRIVAAAVLILVLSGSAAGAAEVLLAPPVDGRITRGFEEPEITWGPGHRGIDYWAEPGTPVRASGPGVVTFAGLVAGIGAVTIDHGSGLETTYTQVTGFSVAEGDQVSTGMWIAQVDSSHGAYGGLHLGVRLDGRYVDPAPFLGPIDPSGAIHLAPVVITVGDDAPDFIPRTAGAAPSGCTPRTALPTGAGPPNDNLAIVVAGIASSTENGASDEIFTVPASLNYAPQDVYRFSYRSTDGPRFHESYGAADTWGDIRAAAEGLRDLLRKVRAAHPGRAVDLIAHSQGGIVARTLLNTQTPWDPGLPRVASLVTLSTPHRGAPLGAVASDLSEGPLGWAAEELAGAGVVPINVGGESVAQLAPGSELMDDLARVDTMFGTRTLALRLVNDLVVPADRATWPGKETITVPPTGWATGHSAIVTSEAALASIYNFLRGGSRECDSRWGGVASGIGSVIGAVERSLGKALGELF